MREVSMRIGDRERAREGEREKDEEEEEKLQYVRAERKNEKEKTRKKIGEEKKVVMFNIMPWLCLKVTSRRQHLLLVCTYVIYIPNDGLLIFSAQKHCSGSWPPRDSYYV